MSEANVGDVPNIEDGGCDICDNPKCYRNQPQPIETHEESDGVMRECESWAARHRIDATRKP